MPAVGGALTLGWVWPGVAGSLPRSWKISITTGAVAAANAAVAADAPGGRINDPRLIRRWADALFAHSPSLSRERVYTLGARSRAITGDQRIDAILTWWATLERDTRNRTAHNDRERVEVAVNVPPRSRARRGSELDVDTIGSVPIPPSSRPLIAAATKRTPDEEEAALAQIDASLAAVDKLLERFNTPSRPARRSTAADDTDD